MKQSTHTYLSGCCAVSAAVISPASLNIAGTEILPILAIPFAISSAWFLDIDIKNSGARKKWKTISIIIAIPAFLLLVLLFADFTGKISVPYVNNFISILLPAIGIAFLNLLAALEMKHRTFTHSAYVLAPWLPCTDMIMQYLPSLALTLNTMLWGCFIGVASHLISDGFTKRGIWLAYPLQIRIKFLPKFLAVSTGKKSETVFTVIATLVIVTFTAWMKLGGFR